MHYHSDGGTVVVRVSLTTVVLVVHQSLTTHIIQTTIMQKKGLRQASRDFKIKEIQLPRTSVTTAENPAYIQQVGGFQVRSPQSTTARSSKTTLRNREIRLWSKLSRKVSLSLLRKRFSACIQIILILWLVPE